MDVRELKIGNWVDDFVKGHVTVWGIEPTWNEVYLNYCHGSGIYKTSIGRLNPIELTDEIIAKLNLFKEGLSVHNSKFSGHIWIQKVDYVTDEKQYLIHIGQFDLMYVKFVHELQNAIHSLTGIELIIKIT